MDIQLCHLGVNEVRLKLKLIVDTRGSVANSLEYRPETEKLRVQIPLYH